MRELIKTDGHQLARIILLTVFVLTMTTTSQYGTVQATDTTTTTSINELKTQNELLQQRSRFTTGGVAMILGIVALLAFLTINSRWTRRLEIKNQQLQRERNVVVAQNKQLAIERDRAEAASVAILRSLSCLILYFILFTPLYFEQSSQSLRVFDWLNK